MNADPTIDSSSGTLLHPSTHMLIAAEIMCFAIGLPTVTGTALLAIFFLTALGIPSRTEFRLTWKFIKILGLGALFLFLIHAVRWNPPGFSREGMLIGVESFTRIASPVIGVIYLSRRVRSEELFAMLIDCRVPPSVILILFRTLWLVPRLTERMDEVVTAQKLRGMRVETTMQRIHALIPTLNPIFSSMLTEISMNSLILSSRGFISPGRKTHLTALRYRPVDIAVITGLTFFLGVLWC